MNAESIIFDMDGTLWDSSENVAASWSETIRSSGDPLLRNKTITGSDLRSVMGMTMVEIAAKLFPELTETRRIDILEKCGENEKNYLAANGGELYPQLEETLSALSKNHRLFIVSNCQSGYIELFLEKTGLADCITDSECAGRTGLSKGPNIRLVADRNHLQNPVYVGDIDGDRQASEEAGVKFCHASYGFGKVERKDYVMKEFSDLMTLFE